MNTLHESVYGRIVRDLMDSHSELMFKFSPIELSLIIDEHVKQVCDNWPEDQGFGSSDSYGILQGVVRELTQRAEKLESK